MRGESRRKSIVEVAPRLFIVAHKEDTTRLEECLLSEGFQVTVVRGPYSEEERRFSRQMKCLLNHGNAWRLGLRAGGVFVVVEADFVPVKGFGSLPMLWDVEAVEDACGWLYSGGPIFFRFDERGDLEGHSATTVAMVISSGAALKLGDFIAEQLEKERSGEYLAWDTYLGNWLRWEAGVPNYLAYRQYGEHGGIANKEHRVHGIRDWHQADVLAGDLMFAPAYAKGSVLLHRLIRTRARLRGAYRLVTGKTLGLVTLRENSQRWRLLVTALRRLVA